MIKTYLTSKDNTIVEGDENQIALWRNSSDSKIWVDIHHHDDNFSDIEAFLTELNCHPLTIQDTFRKRHPPKIEYFEDHIFVLYRGISQVLDDLVFDHQTMGFFISERCLITVHPQASMGINKVIKSNDLRFLHTSPMALALKIMHTSAGIYLEHVLEFENDISNKEDQIRDGFGEKALTELALYKSRLIKIKRVFNYHVSVSQQLKNYEGNPIPFSVEESKHLIVDVDDRFERLHSLTQMHYDICSDLIDSYISITSHQLNNTMRVLTVITAVFVPLSFLAGIYGMNFEHMPELHYKYAYFVLIGAMLLISTGLITFFKRKQWF
ncbi:magnesium transporter CorA family protein [Aestuariicella sp. G3-2]|uniref:magnesium transporter CorA family protein n=1 Tax=Pseudomaricurvus albidus TaxID=2842452 RepID=UPI001C0AD35D|nr:magnesium transporter CorA family protein [Aestuariicella albida]MBU3070584.1 magnesium transporter CorA family protein [Aestuariicella albida]